jgi:hypothetical protein
MGLITCECAYTFRTIVSPHPDGYRLISEQEIDRMRETGMSGDDVLSEIFLKAIEAYKCSACGRLLLGLDADRWTSYRREPDQ